MVGLILVLVSTQIGVTSSSASSYDHWKDLNDDGIIDVNDLQSLASVYGTSGDPINKTELLLDLQDRVEALENQTVPLGYIGPPAYDSGWVSISQPGSETLTHNLGTTNVHVYMTGYSEAYYKTNHAFYGSEMYYTMTGDLIRYGAYWCVLTSTTIDVVRLTDDPSWEQIRVQMWIIQEPPT